MNIYQNKNNIKFDYKSTIYIYENINNLNNIVILPKQVHGNKIVEIINGTENLDGVDGLFTKDKNLKIGVATRDCAPVCLVDNDKIGVVHIGWRGLVNDIYYNILKHFNSKKLNVYVGPFLNKFEIQKDFCFEEIKIKFGEDFFEFDNGKIFFNFRKALEKILPSNTIWDSRKIEDDLSLPSNRRGDKCNFITSIKFDN